MKFWWALNGRKTETTPNENDASWRNDVRTPFVVDEVYDRNQRRSWFFCINKIVKIYKIDKIDKIAEIEKFTFFLQNLQNWHLTSYASDFPTFVHDEFFNDQSKGTSSPTAQEVTPSSAGI